MKKYYHADSKGYYDLEAVLKDIKNKIDVEIDFSEYSDTIDKHLKQQEKYYKK